MLTPLGVGPGQRFPYISGLSLSLGVLARDPETGEERFARVKVPEGLPRFFPIGDGGRMLLLENVIAPLPRPALPGDGDRRARRLPRHARRRLRGLRRRRRPARGGRARAATAALRRRRAPRGLELDVARRCSSGCSRASGSADDQIYEIHGPLDLADLDQLVDLDRPELKYEQSHGATPARLVHVKEPRDLFAEIRRGDFLVHQPYESFAASFEAFVHAAATRSGRDRDEDGRVPDERRQPARAGADRARRGRQAERLPRRAEGALRRAPQHRMVARARAGRRARRLRLPRPEGAREDDAGRPARGRRRCAGTCTSARATTTP